MPHEAVEQTPEEREIRVLLQRAGRAIALELRGASAAKDSSSTTESPPRSFSHQQQQQSNAFYGIHRVSVEDVLAARRRLETKIENRIEAILVASNPRSLPQAAAVPTTSQQQNSRPNSVTRNQQQQQGRSRSATPNRDDVRHFSTGIEVRKGSAAAVREGSHVVQGYATRKK